MALDGNAGTEMNVLHELLKDKWFAAMVAGEAILLILNTALPIFAPLSRGGTAFDFFLVLTAFRIFFLWAIVTRQPAFHIPYLIGAGLFFLGTLPAVHDSYLSFAGYARAPMNWSRPLILFAWTVRLIGVGWHLRIGRLAERPNASALPAGIGVAVTVVFALLMFTPFAFFLHRMDRMIYGIHIESL